MPAARSVNRPDIDVATATRLGRDLFGITGSVAELPSERDRNFRITGEIDAVLKIANADADAARLVAQTRAERHVGERAASIDVPHPLMTVDGEPLAAVGVAGREHLVRAVTYVPGGTLGRLRPKTLPTLRRVGEAAGAVLTALDDYADPGIPEAFAWDLRSAPRRIERLLPAIRDRDDRALVATMVGGAAEAVRQRAGDLPLGVIHGDLNDHNVIVGDRIGVIDFGDVHRSYRVAEVAIAAAYASLGFADPIEAIAAVAAGAADQAELSGPELEAIPPLAVLRLALSVAMAAEQVAADPGNPYLAISERDAWATLRRLAASPQRLAMAHVRVACGREAVAGGGEVVEWLEHHRGELSPVLELPITPETACVIDWSVTSPDASHPAAAPDMDEQIRQTAETMRRHDASVGIGRYGEPRLVYAAPEFAVATNRGPGARTVHLGVDLSCPPGTVVQALMAGEVVLAEIEALDGGYGPCVMLRHEVRDGLAFHTLYGHLDGRSIEGLRLGAAVESGQPIGEVGAPPENGNWPPHLHFQIVTDTAGIDGPFPGVALPDHWAVWSGLAPSPAAALGLPSSMIDAPHPDDTTLLGRRAQLLPPSLSTSYRTPLAAVRGFGSYLYDGWGRAHLDGVNNVAHVGHEHPHVVAALRRQAGLLNTNSRYPHPERVRYLERLLALFPDHLDTAYLVCTGSEANDLALRIATTVTSRRAVAVLEGAYHGHTAALIDASPYKHDGPGGAGAPDHVHVVPLPDPYRAPEHTGLASVTATIESAAEEGGLAAFIAESAPGVAGQIVLPPGWLREAFAAVRRTGALAIADEVQVGLGRVGSHWWEFERNGATPDIVTLGKPLGNGHPLAAVVTTREIATAFANGMEYFNTFGGNPVSCAVGNAVLDVLVDEELPQRASDVGAYVLRGLEALARRHPVIGDVRGIGLFLGLELVVDRIDKQPAARQASYVVERARSQRVLLSVDGLLRNVIKIKPPLSFTTEEADRLLEVLDLALGEDGAQP